MVPNTFHDYLLTLYPTSSGTIASYLTAIRIIDEILFETKRFDLKEESISEIRDPVLLANIIDYVVGEEDKFRHKEKSMFDLGRPNQTSYPLKRFCTSAIRRLGEFINKVCEEDAATLMERHYHNGALLSADLIRKYRIDNKGTERDVQIKQRVGQDLFRAMLLKLYDHKCCITGLEIPEVLRASHIIPWSERIETRLNPENGICLSATYDAAFDKHLISFDEDFRLIISPLLKEHYTSDAFKNNFLKYEGKVMYQPLEYKPSQEYLEVHRGKLIR